MTKVNPNNGNETKSEVFPWHTLKYDVMFFLWKNIKVLKCLSKSKFLTEDSPNNRNETKSNIFS